MSEKPKSRSGAERRCGTGKQAGTGMQIRTVLSLLLPAVAFLLLLLYIRSACCDVVYSDYIRLVNSYLPDTMNPEKLLVPDVLTRIPLTYLMRTVNCALFGYSVTFDRVLGALGLLLSGLVLGRYLLRERLSVGVMLSVYLVLFSLNKWEMLLNGSGYPHFLAFALFYWHFLLLERLYTGTGRKCDRLLAVLLPFLCLLAAGPYLAVYIVCLLLFYGYVGLAGNRNLSIEERESRRFLLLGTLTAIAALVLYILSNHFAVYEYAGAQKVGLLQVLTEQPAFVLHFLLNGFASMLLGGELMETLLGTGTLTYPMIYALGLLVLLAYGLAALLYIRRSFYKRTVLPFLLLLYGLGSHGIVFLSRYIFLNETYAWQSRYSLQYQSGILGIILIFGLYWRERAGERKRKAVAERKAAVSDTMSGKGKAAGKPGSRGEDIFPRDIGVKRQDGGWKRAERGGALLSLLCRLLLLCFLLGNLRTTAAEIRKAPAREASYERMAAAARTLDSYTDEELESIFEYHHGGDRIRAALRILEENGLNVYR